MTTTAALSGAAAGAAQGTCVLPIPGWLTLISSLAVAAAPAENVRILMEGSSSYNSWSHAWKEVFRGTEPIGPVTRHSQARQVHYWMKDVKQMAGRGCVRLTFMSARNSDTDINLRSVGRDGLGVAGKTCVVSGRSDRGLRIQFC